MRSLIPEILISLILIFFVHSSVAQTASATDNKSTVIQPITELTLPEIVTDRPDQTESSTTIPLKSLQIECGVLSGNYNFNNSSEKLFLIPTTLFRYGLTKNIELRLVEQLISVQNKQTSEENFGLSDLEVGAKIQILKNPAINTEIAFISHLVLPTGAVSITNEHVGTINKLAISHGLTDFLDLGYNIGYNYFGHEKGYLTYSLVFGLGLTDRIGAYVETYGEVAEFTDWVSNFDSGITYLVRNNMQLDFSFGLGLNQKMNYFSAGFSWNIPKKQKLNG
jgi:hypothetical protein